MAGQDWGNLELGGITNAARAGHGQASDDGAQSSHRLRSRSDATEGQLIGPTGNAQRAAHSAHAAAGVAQANNVSLLAQNLNRGEQAQAQTVDETSSLQVAGASEGEATMGSLKRPLTAH